MTTADEVKTSAFLLAHIKEWTDDVLIRAYLNARRSRWMRVKTGRNVDLDARFEAARAKVWAALVDEMSRRKFPL